MKVPFWEPQREYKKYKNELDEAYFRVMESGKLVLGYNPDIEEFEKNFAAFVGAKHCIMCGAGTHALYLAYRVADIKPGDEVITTSHTFVATIDQIVAVGAQPILVDIEDDGLIDPKEIEKAITPKTRAIVPVHLEGKVCDMEKIMDIAKRYNLIVIEDSAQAIGATFRQHSAGTIGRLGCYSFFPAKALGCHGNAGAIVTNNDDYAKRLRLLRCNYNLGKNQDIDGIVELGTNMEPDGIQAAILNVKMKYLKQRLARRREIAEKYNAAFAELSKKFVFDLPIEQEGRIYQDYVIKTDSGISKQEFLKHLEKNEIGYIGHNLIPNHKYKFLKFDIELPRTEDYLERQVRIPCNPDLTDGEVDEVIRVIRNYFL
jgi:dTDP-4-amino-4,6-dideoxygalactose transaminase